MAVAPSAPLSRTLLGRSSEYLIIDIENSSNLLFYSMIKIYQVCQFVNKKFFMYCFLFHITIFAGFFGKYHNRYASETGTCAEVVTLLI